MGEKSLTKKEIKLKIKEKNAINEKAIYISKHSKELLNIINDGDEEKIKSILYFLMSDNATDTDLDIIKRNHESYVLSLEVIFKLCSAMRYLGFESEERENMRDKLRLYTKKFKTDSDLELKQCGKFICYDKENYQKIKRMKRK